ncbi:hypothetical protein KDA_68320 [Dictyobacter alpinus]|uniref:Zinc finger CGNR domain-containing protein n=1 Tax=Dictyobacter alpinus TaxID=2014873 RepID=A0A402BIX7_9CHLR|nr:CGNR zinc finger domain-containing protein [Dictyobacter alpinus]GCE31348.1 hypothetical protein KDA_68320 [Dictyobacter alpinus]
MKDYFKNLIQLAEDFVNTYDLYLEQPEWLQNTHDLETFLLKHSIKFSESLGEEILHEAYQLRDQLRMVYEAKDDEDAAHILNGLLRGAQFQVKLVHEDTQNWQVQVWNEPGMAPLQQLRAASAVGLSYALEHYGKSRLRSCASEPCRDVFLDTSRNGTRRFCNDRCANRYNIAAFRARQRRLE